MRGAVAAVLVLVLGACAGPVPSASPSPPSATAVALVPTPAASPLASAPSSAVQTTLKGAGITFVPLTDAQLATVAVTRADAEQTALANRGFGYGPDGALVIWKKVGCVFLGYYTGGQMPSFGYVPPTYPAYMVQVLADPIPDFPLLNIGVMVVNAVTGEAGTAYGGGEAPYGTLGTTCGVSP